MSINFLNTTRDHITHAYAHNIVPELRNATGPVSNLCRAIYDNSELALELIKSTPLSKGCGKHKLTPLMMAVIFDKRELIEAILAQPDNGINAKSAHDLTALHHAAVKGGHLMKRLISGGALTNIRNAYLATPDDLLKLCHGWKKPSHSTIVFKECPTAEERILTAQEFKKLTNAELIDENIYPPLHYIKNWAKRKSTKHFPNPKDYPPQPSQVGLMQMSETGLGAYALCDIPFGRAVIEYKGVVSKTNGSEYFMPNIEGALFRNLGPMIQDGMPNVCPEINFAAKGMKRIIFTAVSTIKKGDALIFNYGLCHPVKKGIYKELGFEAMRGFVKKDIFNPCINFNNLISRYFETTFNYIFCTPTVTYKLILENLIGEKELDHLLSLSHLNNEYFKSKETAMRFLIDISNDKEVNIVKIKQYLYKFIEMSDNDSNSRLIGLTKANLDFIKSCPQQDLDILWDQLLKMLKTPRKA